MPPDRRALSRRQALRLGFASLGFASLGSMLGAALLAACGGGGDGDPPAAAPAAGAAAPTAAPDAPRSLLAPEETAPASARGVLRVGVAGEPRAPAALVHARLVAVDPRSAAIRGDLALGVEQAGPLDLAVRLRPGAAFHAASADGEGEPLGAEAVRRDFEAREAAGEFLFREAVAVVETPAPDTLRLRLRAPFAYLFEFLGDTASGAVRARPLAAPGLPPGPPAGAGPFAPAPGEDGGFALLPHPRYHRPGLPVLDGVRLVASDRPDALDAAFAGGALDVHAPDAPESLDRAAQRPGARVLARSARRIRGLGLSLAGPGNGARAEVRAAFQDERVRRAVFRSIAHDAIARLGDGAGAAHPHRRHGPVDPSFGADALPPGELAAHPLYDHDRADARRLLGAAGASGLAFAITAPSAPPLDALARLVAGHLREGGFDPAVVHVPAAEWRRRLAGGDFEAILFELDPIHTPDAGLRLHRSGGLDGVSPWGYSNPVYDEALDRAFAALHPAERAERSRAAQRLLLDAVPAMITLPGPSERIAVSARVAGYAWETHGFNEAWLAARWSLRPGGDPS